MTECGGAIYKRTPVSISIFWSELQPETRKYDFWWGSEIPLGANYKTFFQMLSIKLPI